MAKFLNTSGTNYYLEKLIKTAHERLILISPYLQLNVRIKELLEDKNRLKIDTRIVYGKSDLHPEEIGWLRTLNYVRTSYCQNLHAKCYLSESACIITSMNLYEFSQINNNEMGIAISKHNDPELYLETYAEAKRIIRISDEIRLNAEKIRSTEVATEDTSYKKLTTHKLAQKLGQRSKDLFPLLIKQNFLERKEGKHYITEKGKRAGGEFRWSKNGPYFLWPSNLFEELELVNN